MEWRRGMPVRGAAGHELGRLLAWGDDGFVVERGWLVPRHFVATREQVALLRADEVRLRVDRLASCDIDDAPGEWGYVAAPQAALGQLARVDEREWYAAADDPHAQAERSGEHGLWAGGARRATRVPLAEEQAALHRQMRVTERVRVRVVVKTEQRTLVVPVRRKEVVIERVPALAHETTALDPGERVGEPRVTVIPVVDEEVEIRKHPVVREEVRITRTFRRELPRRTTDVRREAPDVAVHGSPGDGAPASNDEPS